MAGEVKYWLNGIFFKDYGVRVSSSPGLYDSLKRKTIQQYNWAEYHGISLDLKKPHYEARTFELKCFIDSSNWKEMFNRFNTAIRDQFYKSGTQRLEIEPYGNSKLAYEVYVQDSIEVEKTFKDGRMIGVFTIKMIEPNPIKKILKTSLDEFALSYEIDSETEIFLGDGTKLIGRGDVSFTKRYSEPSYQGSGITLIQTSSVNETFYEAYTIPEKENIYEFSVTAKLTASKDIVLYVIGRTVSGSYEAVAVSKVHQGITGKNRVSVVEQVNFEDYGKFIFKVLDDAGAEIPGITFENPRIETAEILGEWRDVTGKEKIIIIAGNIEDMKNLQTPAEIIWDKI